MSNIRIEGGEELLKKITSLQQMTHVKRAVAEATSMLRKEVARYPDDAASHRPNPMLRGNSAKAKRMRAGFFYHLNNPNSSRSIEVPYRRGRSPGSQKLGGSWIMRMENQGFRGIIGTGVSYSRLVQDSAKQTAYHKQTGWQTTDDIVDKHGRRAINMVQTALRQEVNS